MKIDLVLPTDEEYQRIFGGDGGFRHYSISPGAFPPSNQVFPLGQHDPEILLSRKWSTPYLMVCDNDYIVGSIGGKGLLEGEDEVELGYNVAPAYRNQGIATYAIRKIQEEASRDGIALLALVESDNVYSKKALLTAGFRFNGRTALFESTVLERYDWSP